MEQCGIMEVKCHSNGLTAELNFKPAGWYSKDLNCVEGFVLDKNKTKHSFLYGKWSESIYRLDVEHYEEYQRVKDLVPPQKDLTPAHKDSATSLFNRIQRKKSTPPPNVENGDSCEGFRSLAELPSTLLWEADPRPLWTSEYYNFTYFAMALNECSDEARTTLPLTDSRLRPDIKKLEEGDIDGAAFEKNRLEEKQREVRKMRKKDRTIWVPMWFESKPHPYAKEESWSYKGGYWERNFSNCPDIF